MFDRHLNSTWKKAFEVRNLEAWSAAPLILFPTYYTGEAGYISDTEDSILIDPNEGVADTFDSDDELAKVFVLISDSNGKTVEKKGNKEIFNESTSDDSSLEDEIVNIDPNEILMNTVADALADAVKSEL